MYWLLLLAIVPSIYLFDTREKKNRAKIIRVRKLFHLLCVLMFGIPLAFRHTYREFISVAGCCVLAGMIVLENWRCQEQKNVLLLFMKPFLDEKDSKSKFVSSHIQLLFANIFPVWIASLFPDIEFFKNSTIFVLAGVLTIGIGDSAAAIGGLASPSPHRLPKSQKSLEGLVSFIAAISITLACMRELTVPNFVATVAAGLSECYSSKYDNLVVPIVFSTILLAYDSLV